MSAQLECVELSELVAPVPLVTRVLIRSPPSWRIGPTLSPICLVSNLICFDM
jgi:hypothetical protein